VRLVIIFIIITISYIRHHPSNYLNNVMSDSLLPSSAATPASVVVAVAVGAAAWLFDTKLFNISNKSLDS
jgi:hypothetical protein